MGWDMHFFNTKKIGDILGGCPDIRIEIPEEPVEYGDKQVIFMYMDSEEGKSGLCVPVSSYDTCRDDLLLYGYRNYGGHVGLLLWTLYRKFGIKFADSFIQDYCHLQDLCENEEEEQKLIDYCCSGEMMCMFKEFISDDHKLHKIHEETTPVYEKLLKKLKEKK